MKENNNVWRVFSVGMTIISVMVGAAHFNHGRWGVGDFIRYLCILMDGGG